jgi:hypothetical protein
MTVNWFTYRVYLNPAQVGRYRQKLSYREGFCLSYGYGLKLSYRDPVILSTVNHYILHDLMLPRTIYGTVNN